jgi:hypothetical protein
MSSAKFEPAIPAIQRLQTAALYLTATYLPIYVVPAKVDASTGSTFKWKLANTVQEATPEKNPNVAITNTETT